MLLKEADANSEEVISLRAEGLAGARSFGSWAITATPVPSNPGDPRGAQMSLSVGEVMIHAIHTVTADTSLPEVSGILAERPGSAVLVVAEDGEVVGVVTEAVLAAALARIIEASEDVRGVRARLTGEIGRLSATA